MIKNMQKAEWKCYERMEDNARESEGRKSRERTKSNYRNTRDKENIRVRMWGERGRGKNLEGLEKRI
jgi:hypothetical protein